MTNSRQIQFTIYCIFSWKKCVSFAISEIYLESDFLNYKSNIKLFRCNYLDHRTVVSVSSNDNDPDSISYKCIFVWFMKWTNTIVQAVENINTPNWLMHHHTFPIMIDTVVLLLTYIHYHRKLIVWRSWSPMSLVRTGKRF